MVKSPNNLQISVPLSIREKLQLLAVDNESVSLVAKRILLEALGENSASPAPSIAPDALEEIRDRLNVIEKISYVTKTDLAPYWEALGKIGDRLNTLEDGIGLSADDLDRLVQILKERIFDESLKQLGDRLNTLENERPQQTQEFLQKLMTENKFDLLEQYGDRLTELEEKGFQLDPDDLNRLINIVKQQILEDGFGDRLNQLEKDQPEFHESMTNLVERLEKLEGWLSSLRDDRALAKCSLGKFSDRLESLEENLNGWISGFKKEGDWQAQQIAHAAVRLDALEKGKVETAPREIPTGLTHKEMSLVCGIAPSNLGKVAKNRDSWPEGYMWSDESKKWFPMEV